MRIRRQAINCIAILLCSRLLVPCVVSAAEASPSPDLAERFSPVWVQLGKRLKASSSTFVDIDASRHALSPSLADGSNTPYLTWIELNAHGVPQIRVMYWDQGAWIPLGDVLNLHSARRAYDPVIAVAGSNLYVAWIELNREGVPQLYVKRWTGDGWVLAGEKLNNDPTKPAANPSMTAASGKLYLAWTEHDDKRVYQVHVKVLTETGWTELGSALNQDPRKDAIEPSIAAIGDNPYVVWCERAVSGYFQVLVKRWSGKTWLSEGEGLNLDSSAHALSPSIASDGTVPYVAWVEFDKTGISQVHVKQRANNTWNPVGGSLNLDPGHHALSPSLVLRKNTPYIAWAEFNSKEITQIHVKHWTGSDWLLEEQSLNLDISKMASAPTISVYGEKPYIAWKESDETGLYGIVVKARK